VAGARKGEEGAALLIALMLLGLLMVVSVGASTWSASAMRGQERRENSQDEYWRARSAAANVEASLQHDIPTQYQSDVLGARQMSGQRPLPSFDKTEVTAESSRPVARVNPTTGALERTQYELDTCTSLLGQLNAWAATRAPLAEAYASTRGYGPDVVKVAEFYETSRRTFQSDEPAYVLRYKIDGRAGHNRVRPFGDVTLGPVAYGCGTGIEMTAEPSSVVRGSGTTLTVTYNNANRIVITKSTGETLLDQNVAEQSSAQTLTLPQTPAATATYTAQAFGSGGCGAITPPIPVTVTDPPCPEIRTFVANPTNVSTGGGSTITWDVAFAAEVRINGTLVANSGSMPVNPLTTTTYTLTAVGAGGWCPQSAQVTVTVTPCPTIDLFDVQPTTITAGDPVTVRWSVGNAGPGVTVTLNGNPVAASGSTTFRPNATTAYTLHVAGPGACSPQDRSITVTVNPPLCPTITSFSVSPASVNEGGTVTVTWSVANAANAASITLRGPGINQAVGASGSLPFTLSTAGDYTFTLDVVPSVGGCAPQSVSAPVTVTPGPTPTPTPTPTPPGPVCPGISSFAAAPTCTLPGGAVNLLWSASDADVISINGASGYPLSGNLTVNPLATTTYTLAAARAGCSTITRDVTVEVGTPPVITSFAAAPGTITAGGSSSLNWSVVGATSATINGAPVDPAGGSMSVSPASTTDYVLQVASAGCNGATISQTVRVTVQAPCPQPRIDFFQANPTSVLVGQSTTVQWSVSNLEAGATVTLSGPNVNRQVAAVDSTSITPPAVPGSYTYRLSAVNPCNPGLVIEQLVTIDVLPCPAPQIAAFSANPTSVIQGSGGFIRLSWQINDPSGSGVSVSISPSVGGGLPSSGFVDVSAPATTTTYTLTATSGCGTTATAQVTVTVSACPKPQVASFTANPASVTQGAGGTVRLSWQVNDPSGTGVSVSISPGGGSGLPATGFIDIPAPGATTTYTLTASNGCGESETAQVTITASPSQARGWQGANQVGGLAENSLNATLTENPDGSVTCEGMIGGLGIGASALGDQLNVTLSKSGAIYYNDSPAITVVAPGGFPIHQFSVTIPSAQVPAGAALSDMQVKAAVSGTIFFFSYTEHVSIDTTLPCGQPVPGDDPPFGFILNGPAWTGQYIKTWTGAPDAVFPSPSGCN
jgi:alpha-D-ribose 1-methylphosphonate 5-triphosphate synthase subunit PhnH